MSEKYFTVNYGKGVAVFPEKALDKIISGEASLTEIKTLSLILTHNGAITVDELAALSETDAQAVENAVAFWRGVGIITLGKSKGSSNAKKTAVSTLVPADGGEENADGNAAEALGAVTYSSADGSSADNAVNSTPATDNDSVNSNIINTTDNAAANGSVINTPATDNAVADASYINGSRKKALLSAEMPKYGGQEISALLEKDGGKLKLMIDECQQLIGHIFNPRETETLVGICDWLGVDSDFVITLTAYYTRKKPGCKVGYIQRAALDLVNSGVDTIELLDEYLKNMELYDGLGGKLRGWLGIGAREYTKNEKSHIMHWVKDLKYGEDVVKYAYEVTVENTLSFNFKYANNVLESWYKDGVKTLADAQAREAAFKAEKISAKGSSDGKKSSFDTDEFFNLAVKRSYEKMSGIKNKKEQ